jgi:hypothetical protein
MISRIKRGHIDEIKDPEIPTDFSYMGNKGRLNGIGDTWDTYALTQKTDNTAPLSSDVEKKNTAKADLEPDEFVFNFNGYSGSFMLNHEGKWIFRGNNPSEFRLKTPVQVDENVHVNLTNDVSIDEYPRAIMSFTIITNDGTEYCFGGDQSSIDFTYLIDKSFIGETFKLKAHKNVSPMGWHLTKIKYVSGKEIEFIYNKEEFIIVGNKTRNLGLSSTKHTGLVGSTTSNYNISPQSSYTIQRNSYLCEIRTPYEVIKFDKLALSGYADYPFEESDWPSSVILNIKLQTSVDMNKRKWFKLNKIQTFKNPIVNTSQKPLKEYQLDYIKSASNRLQLQAIKQIDVETPTNSITQYAFEYNTVGLLPPYFSGKIDHWGYFNNNGMLGTFSPTFTSETTYQGYRQPNETVMQYEMLKKITYPTGGFTSFTFEPHKYKSSFNNVPSQSANNAAFTLNNETTESLAGGLRVSKIVSFDGVNEIEKRFLYVKNYKNNPTSSGILANKPTYFDDFIGTIGEIQVLDHYFMNEQSLNPLNLTSGSPVTYSEVVELNKDNSYNIYKFSNFDDVANCNRTPKKTVSGRGSTIINPKRDPFIDYEHLRGRILEERKYSVSDQIVRLMKNEYETTLKDA